MSKDARIDFSSNFLDPVEIDQFIIGEYVNNLVEDFLNVIYDRYRRHVVLRGGVVFRSLRYPMRVELALTYRCNNLCYFCLADCAKNDVKIEMDTVQWKKIIDKLINVGVPQIVFTGGEATLRNDLLELIRYCSNRVMVGLLTNGRLLSLEYCRSLIEAGLNYAKISIESDDYCVHDRMTSIEGSWNETWEGLKNALKTGLFVIPNTTLLKENCGGIKTLMSSLNGLGIKNITLNGLICSGGGVDCFSSKMSSAETFDTLSTVFEYSKSLDMEVAWMSPICLKEGNLSSLGIKNSCSAAKGNISIEPDGVVIPCQSWLHESGGNILTDNWSSIWRSPVMMKARFSHVTEKCVGCEWIDPCDGACPLDDINVKK
jgi:radical SAM protein with 4Fe4S-binding SPASM domain